MSAEPFLWALTRTTLLVLLSGLLVQVLLRQSRYNRFARVCWFSVLLSGWIWMPFFSWSIPWFERPEPANIPLVFENPQAVLELTVSPVVAAKPPAVFGPSAIPDCLFGLWLAGISGIVVFRLAVYLRCLLLLGKTVLADQNESADWAALLREQKIDPRRIPLCFSENLGPSLLGTPLGYRLVIPRMIWDELSPAAREGVLRHELTHFLRRDIAKSLLARFLALPHWFNPLARLAVRRFEEAAEYRCDEAAFAPTQEGQSAFAEALLTLHESVEHVVVFRHAIWGNGLTNRIAYILNFETRKELSTMRKTVVVTLIALLFAAGLIRPEFVEKSNAQPSTPETAVQAEPEPTADNTATSPETVGDREEAVLEHTVPEPEQDFDLNGPVHNPSFATKDSDAFNEFDALSSPRKDSQQTLSQEETLQRDYILTRAKLSSLEAQLAAAKKFNPKKPPQTPPLRDSLLKDYILARAKLKSLEVELTVAKEFNPNEQEIPTVLIEDAIKNDPTYSKTESMVHLLDAELECRKKIDSSDRDKKIAQVLQERLEVAKTELEGLRKTLQPAKTKEIRELLKRQVQKDIWSKEAAVQAQKIFVEKLKKEIDALPTLPPKKTDY